jgi:formate hydrogenlyase transcriptional activator
MNKLVEEIPSETMEAIVAYDWPGNVRQLQNFIEHGVIVSSGPVFQPPLSQLRAQKQSVVRDSKTLEEAAREHILEVLKGTNWVIGGRQGAAARLGVARTTLISKMRRLGIEALAAEARAGSANRQTAFAAVS